MNRAIVGPGIPELSPGYFFTMDYNQTYRKHWYHVFCYAKKIVGQEGAEEAVVHVFVQLWKKWGVFANDNEVTAFCKVVARNKCLDIKKREKPAVYHWGYFDDLELPMWFYDEYDEIRRQVIDKLLDEGIEKLPKKTRRVIRMALKGYGPKETAKQLGLSEHTIWRQKNIAIKSLRQFFAGQDYK